MKVRKRIKKAPRQRIRKRIKQKAAHPEVVGETVEEKILSYLHVSPFYQDSVDEIAAAIGEQQNQGLVEIVLARLSRFMKIKRINMSPYYRLWDKLEMVRANKKEAIMAKKKAKKKMTRKRNVASSEDAAPAKKTTKKVAKKVGSKKVATKKTAAKKTSTKKSGPYTPREGSSTEKAYKILKKIKSRKNALTKLKDICGTNAGKTLKFLIEKCPKEFSHLKD